MWKYACGLHSRAQSERVPLSRRAVERIDEKRIQFYGRIVWLRFVLVVGVAERVYSAVDERRHHAEAARADALNEAAARNVENVERKRAIEAHIDDKRIRLLSFIVKDRLTFELAVRQEATKRRRRRPRINTACRLEPQHMDGGRVADARRRKIIGEHDRIVLAEDAKRSNARRC